MRRHHLLLALLLVYNASGFAPLAARRPLAPPRDLAPRRGSLRGGAPLSMVSLPNPMDLVGSAASSVGSALSSPTAQELQIFALKTLITYAVPAVVVVVGVGVIFSMGGSDDDGSGGGGDDDDGGGGMIGGGGGKLKKLLGLPVPRARDEPVQASFVSASDRASRFSS